MPDHLMSGDDGRFSGSEFSLNDMQVRAAYRAHFHPHQDFAGAGHRLWKFAALQRIGLYRGRCAQETSLHAEPSSRPPPHTRNKAANTRVLQTIHKRAAEEKAHRDFAGTLLFWFWPRLALV